MSVNITAIYGSPRQGGNTDMLMQAFLDGLRSAGGKARELYLRNFRLYPCTECGGCDQTGCCVLQDDMDVLYRFFEESDVLVVAAPVFFYGFGAMAKAMVDRSQCFWVRKYRLKQDMNKERPSGSGRGILLSVGGSGGSRTFEGVLLSARYFFDALGMSFAHNLTYGSVDEAGAVLRHPTACVDAQKLGRAVAAELLPGA
jgi:multimeric flavodoxin WrbA